MPRHQSTAAHAATEQPASPILNDYLTAAQLCAELGCHPLSLYRWRAAGIGPRATYIGRVPLFKRSHVAEWLETRAEKAKARAG
jgi:hypothetical protein